MGWMRGALVCVVATATACGDRGTEPVGDGEPIPFEELGDVYRRDLCTVLVECLAVEYSDIDHCFADTYDFGGEAVRADRSAGSFDYDPMVAGRCQALFERDPCGYYDLYAFSLFGYPTVGEVFAQCPYVTSDPWGTVSAGGSCYSELACAPGSECTFDGMCPGTCTALGGEGSECSNVYDCDVSARLTCIDETCQRVDFDPVAPCRSDDDCGSGECLDFGEWIAIDVCWIRQPRDGPCTDDLDCSPVQGCVEGQCIDGGSRAIGEACGIDFDCAPGAYCTVDDLCAAIPGEGDPCTGFECPDDMDCHEIDGVCRPLAREGESCASLECASGLACEDDRCAALRRLGDACGPDLPCTLARCGAGDRCEPRVGVGAACDGDGDCQSDRCSTDGTCVDPFCGP